MEVKIIREKHTPKGTKGRLYINGKYSYDTLENKDKGLVSSMQEVDIKAQKTQNCAIPTGTYRVTTHQPSITLAGMQEARKFRMRTPIIHGVKCFKNVCIHPKNKYIHYINEEGEEVLAEGLIRLLPLKKPKRDNATYHAWESFMDKVKDCGVLTLTIERNYKE